MIVSMIHIQAMNNHTHVDVIIMPVLAMRRTRHAHQIGQHFYCQSPKKRYFTASCITCLRRTQPINIAPTDIAIELNSHAPSYMTSSHRMALLRAVLSECFHYCVFARLLISSSSSNIRNCLLHGACQYSLLLEELRRFLVASYTLLVDPMITKPQNLSELHALDANL